MLACGLKGVPTGTDMDNVPRTWDPHCPPGQQFDAFQLICVRDIIIP